MRENPIGESIYNRIKEYDLVSRKVFLNNLSSEHRALYNKYSAVVRKRHSLENEANKEAARTAARVGMQNLRNIRPKEQQQQQRKPYDEKYEIKRRLSREEASTIIQKQYRKMKKDKQKNITNNKMYSNLYGNSYVDNYINSYLDLISNETDKKPVGRPKKPRNPVGRPRKEN